MPLGPEDVAPGGWIVLKPPLSQRKPRVTWLASSYQPTIRPLSMAVGLRRVDPGGSIVVSEPFHWKACCSGLALSRYAPTSVSPSVAMGYVSMAPGMSKVRYVGVARAAFPSASRTSDATAAAAKADLDHVLLITPSCGKAATN